MVAGLKNVGVVTDALGVRIQQARSQYGINQAELARRVGVHRGHLCKVEHGTVLPSAKLLDKLADVLEIDPIELYALAQRCPKNASPAQLQRWVNLMERTHHH
jgi:transcriptional regulator with XRE-family HTH domain